MNKKAYKAKQLIDGLKDRPYLDVAVLVEGKKICHICPSSALEPNVEVVDYGEATLLPGLMDTHVHLADDGSAEPRHFLENEPMNITLLRCARRAFESLSAGVTTLRDMAAPAGIVIDLRDAINMDIIAGPRILTCDTVFTITGGYGKKVNLLGREVDGAEGARKATREIFKAGADFVKVMASGKLFAKGTDPGQEQFTQDELAAVVQEAHKFQKKAAAHAISFNSIKNAVHAGFDSIEHANFIDKGLAESMAEKGVYMIPTLLPFFVLAHPPEGVSFEKNISSKAKKIWEVTLNAFSTARAAGVEIAAGTDSGGPCTPHNSIVEELDLLLTAGFTPMEAIKSATSVAARALGIADEVGTLETGKLADIIAVEGNPLQDIKNLKKIKMVMRNGQDILSAGGKIFR